jgi:hypothetical protein
MSGSWTMENTDIWGLCTSRWHYLQLRPTRSDGWMTSELERLVRDAVVAITAGTTQILDWNDWGKPGKNLSQDTRCPGRDSNRFVSMTEKWGTCVQYSTALDLKSSRRWVLRVIIFCDLTTCSLVQIHRRFGGTQWLNLQDWRVIQEKASKMQAASKIRWRQYISPKRQRTSIGLHTVTPLRRCHSTQPCIFDLKETWSSYPTPLFITSGCETVFLKHLVMNHPSCLILIMYMLCIWYGVV